MTGCERLGTRGARRAEPPHTTTATTAIVTVGESGTVDALAGRMHTLRNLTLSLTTTGLLIACGASQQTPISNTAADQPTITSQDTAQRAVVDRLAAARCDQEEGCNNVGPGAKFVSRQVCMDKLRGDIGNELNAYNCPHGLDSDAVDRCMMAIKSEECSHPFDTLTRYDKCRTSAICMK